MIMTARLKDYLDGKEKLDPKMDAGVQHWGWSFQMGDIVISPRMCNHSLSSMNMNIAWWGEGGGGGLGGSLAVRCYPHQVWPRNMKGGNWVCLANWHRVKYSRRVHWRTLELKSILTRVPPAPTPQARILYKYRYLFFFSLHWHTLATFSKPPEIFYSRVE